MLLLKQTDLGSRTLDNHPLNNNGRTSDGRCCLNPDERSERTLLRKSAGQHGQAEVRRQEAPKYLSLFYKHQGGSKSTYAC